LGLEAEPRLELNYAAGETVGSAPAAARIRKDCQEEAGVVDEMLQTGEW
jgi:hypothetical protein